MGLGQSRRQLAAQRAEHDLLFRAHYPTVVAFLACRVPVEDAKDLGAEVFVEAWRQRDHVVVDEDRGWLPWLFTVARRMSNAWVAAQAAAGARNARIAPPALEDFTARVVEVDAANQQLSAALAAMLRLGEEDREVLELCGLFGFTPAQASITLGVPAGTVRVRLHRARQRLAEAIEGEVAS
jgi:RNA polymerase sigma-70 factor (ECF subfamily)